MAVDSLSNIKVSKRMGIARRVYMNGTAEKPERPNARIFRDDGQIRSRNSRHDFRTRIGHSGPTSESQTEFLEVVRMEPTIGLELVICRLRVHESEFLQPNLITFQ